MLRYFQFFFVFLVCIHNAVGQTGKPSIDSLRAHVYNLACDDFKGRKTGEEGGRLATEYIKSRFVSYGLEPLLGNSFTFPYRLIRNENRYGVLTCNENVLFWPWHFYLVSNYVQNDTLSNKLVFAGYGTDSELDHLPIDGNAIAFISNSPDQAYQSILNIKKRYQVNTFFVIFISKNKEMERAWSIDYALHDFSLSSDFNELIQEKETHKWSQPPKTDSLNIFYCFPNVLRNVFNKSDRELNEMAKENQAQKGQVLKKFPHPDVQIFISNSEEQEILEVENVCGFVKGKDSTQTIVISAHYDHIGEEYGRVFYGADDNASGTSALLENARLIAMEANNENLPDKNILFIAFSGEEMGLLGSKAFVNQPPFPINELVMNINLDMIGRWDERHKKNRGFVYLLTSGADSRKHFKMAKHLTNIPVEFKVSNKPGYKERMTFKYGSDHHNFLNKGIPIAVFFTGLHKDYHTPNDTPEKINYENLTNITWLVNQYIYKVSNTKSFGKDK